MLILGRSDVHAVVDGADDRVCDVVRETYVLHANHGTSVPHSVFLRFPDNAANRIIALPAFVGGRKAVAGVKWISSFPANIADGKDRASAAILLNSMVDGTPVALVEGSVLSARRTGASAAIAADELTKDAAADVRGGVGLLGCGVINFEVLRFLRSRLPELAAVTVFDLDVQRAEAFTARVRFCWPDLAVEVADSAEATLAAHRIFSVATTAGTPYLTTEAAKPGTVVLHLSLRDLMPESILTAHNVVDDADHVCRAGTSLELAERITGDRSFIHAEIGDILAGTTPMPYDAGTTTVFSPFGLGALDTALAADVLDAATSRGLGVSVADFLSA